jgi:hypothetical protein
MTAATMPLKTILAAIVALGAFSADRLPGAPDAVRLCVMTFNLRYADSKPPNSWPERRPVMRHCILQVHPDIIGTQEGLYPQLKEIASDLRDYDWIGLGRDGGSRSEFMAVFYLRDRLEPVAFDPFWLSDTPEVVGYSTWGVWAIATRSAGPLRFLSGTGTAASNRGSPARFEPKSMSRMEAGLVSQSDLQYEPTASNHGLSGRPACHKVYHVSCAVLIALRRCGTVASRGG